MNNNIVYIGTNDSNVSDKLEPLDTVVNAIERITEYSFHFNDKYTQGIYSIDLLKLSQTPNLAKKFKEVYQSNFDDPYHVYSADSADAYRRLEELESGTAAINDYNIPVQVRDLAAIKGIFPTVVDSGLYDKQEKQTDGQLKFHHIKINFTDGDLNSADQTSLIQLVEFIRKDPAVNAQPTDSDEAIRAKIGTRFGPEMLTLYVDALEFYKVEPETPPPAPVAASWSIPFTGDNTYFPARNFYRYAEQSGFATAITDEVYKSILASNNAVTLAELHLIPTTYKTQLGAAEVNLIGVGQAITSITAHFMQSTHYCDFVYQDPNGTEYKVKVFIDTDPDCGVIDVEIAQGSQKSYFRQATGESALTEVTRGRTSAPTDISLETVQTTIVQMVKGIVARDESPVTIAKLEGTFGE